LNYAYLQLLPGNNGQLAGLSFLFFQLSHMQLLQKNMCFIY